MLFNSAVGWRFGISLPFIISAIPTVYILIHHLSSTGNILTEYLKFASKYLRLTSTQAYVFISILFFSSAIWFANGNGLNGINLVKERNIFTDKPVSPIRYGIFYNLALYSDIQRLTKSKKGVMFDRVEFSRAYNFTFDEKSEHIRYELLENENENRNLKIVEFPNYEVSRGYSKRWGWRETY